MYSSPTFPEKFISSKKWEVNHGKKDASKKYCLPYNSKEQRCIARDYSQKSGIIIQSLNC